MGDIIKFPKAPVFDLTVFALPYTDDRIAAAQAIGQDAANKSFDQMRALFGGADGMQIVSRLIAQAPAALRKGGLLIFEFGLGQLHAVEGAVSRTPSLTLLDVKHDLQDIPRTAVVQRT